MIFRLPLFMCILALMVGCAIPQQSLTKQAQESIRSTEHILIVPQSNLLVDVPATNAYSGGALGVLIAAGIDSVRRSHAEKEAAPIIQQLQSYDFRAVMLDALSSEIEKSDKVNTKQPIRLETIESESQQRITFDQSNADAVLFTKAAYRLVSGNLIITADVKIFPKTNNLLKLRIKPDAASPLNGGNAIYFKVFSFTKQGITASNVKESLSDGAVSVAKQIVADLSHPL